MGMETQIGVMAASVTISSADIIIGVKGDFGHFPSSEQQADGCI